MVGVHHGQDRPAHWSGLERCASIWACPVCSAVIRNERAREIQEAADRWTACGGSVVMVTATMRHGRHDALAETLDVVLAGWSRMLRQRGWKALLARYGVVGYVRSVEVTYGWLNGWHPHVHALLFVRALEDSEVEAVERDVFDLWGRIVVKATGRTILRQHGVKVSRATSAEYVAKVQEHDRAGAEMARQDLKRGRGLSVMPFELLDSEGASSRKLWAEYVAATHGRRAITWSRDLRTLLGLDVERTDEEVMAETETDELVMLLDGGTYDRMRDDPARLCAVLEDVEARPPRSMCHNSPRLVPVGLRVATGEPPNR